MLFPFTRGRTRRQKSLTVASVVVALAFCGTGIYCYERYYRGPGPEILYGMWYGPNFFTNDPGYLELRRDGNFSFGTFSDDGHLEQIFGGRWYAGGAKIHLLFGPDTVPKRPWVLHIVDVEGDQLRIRFFRDGDARDVLTYHRVRSDSPIASNHAMERTADRCVSTF
jgi:hypothetical protein